METKKHIRHQILEQRETMPQDECSKKSKLILQKVLADEHYQKAACLLTYLDYKKEVETTQLVEQAWLDGKSVYCPKIIGQTMVFYRISSFSEVRVGYKGIPEPVAPEEPQLIPTIEVLRQALCIMPGVVFDRQLHRIGYGKGFYDRFLADKDGLMTIALCFDYQLLEAIPSGKFDLRPKILYTETQKLSLSGREVTEWTL